MKNKTEKRRKLFERLLLQATEAQHLPVQADSTEYASNYPKQGQGIPTEPLLPSSHWLRAVRQGKEM